MDTQVVAPTKRANACLSCRERKVKCSGEDSCQSCLDHGRECKYPARKRKKRKGGNLETAILERQLAEMQALLQAANNPPPLHLVESPTLNNTAAPTSVRHLYHQTDGFLGGEERVPSNSKIQQGGLSEDRITGPLIRTSQGLDSTRSPQSLQSGYFVRKAETDFDSPTPNPDYGSEAIIDAVAEDAIDKEESIISPQNVNWEYHGPGSWLSICSIPGIQWVLNKTGTDEFPEIAQRLTRGWTKRLKMQRSLKRDRAPELDGETAWKYTEAYFEGCFYSSFGIVHRPAFEARLRLHLTHLSSTEDDLSWFALRNVVYASGCRIVLSRDPSVPFAEVQTRAWSYFENALSVHTDLLYTATSLMAVQALALMALYVDGLGTPALAYMLSSTAVRLAQSKGLHRQPAKVWKLPEIDILQRNWLFWAIYCCEKAIVSRSGRPSAIDEDEISCQVPTTTSPGSSVDVEFVTHAIKHARISSLISKRLVSVTAVQQSAVELIEIASDLSQRLQAWCESLPILLKPTTSKRLLKSSSPKDAINIIYIHYAYYGSLIAINTVFTYPWTAAIIGLDRHLIFQQQTPYYTERVAGAARNIILSMMYMDMDASFPSWLAFYYPMLGVINLFITILKDPVSSSADSDLALMDMVAGHFAHLEFLTSAEFTYPFAREVAGLARATVKKERENTFAYSDTAAGGARMGLSLESDVPDFWNYDARQIDIFNGEEFNIGSWNTFSMMPTENGCA